MSWNKLGDPGAKIIARSLTYNKTLIHLNLSSNGICKYFWNNYILATTGLWSIFDALFKNNTLISLDISSSERIRRNKLEMYGVNILKNLMSKTYILSYLNLSLIGLGNGGIDLLWKGLIDNQTILSLLIQNNELTYKWIPSIK